MQYEQVKNLSEKEFRRLTGIRAYPKIPAILKSLKEQAN